MSFGKGIGHLWIILGYSKALRVDHSHVYICHHIVDFSTSCNKIHVSYNSEVAILPGKVQRLWKFSLVISTLTKVLVFVSGSGTMSMLFRDMREHIKKISSEWLLEGIGKEVRGVCWGWGVEVRGRGSCHGLLYL